MCLVVVTLWFIYQLKHESIWAGWVRAVMKQITIGAHWIWKIGKRPYEKFKQNLHLQRNIYWYLVFLMQREVGADISIQGIRDR